MTEPTQQTSTLPPPFAHSHSHSLQSPSNATATTSTTTTNISNNINTSNDNTSNSNIKVITIDNPDPITNIKSILKPNPTSSSSYPNFYTVFSPKTTAPSSVSEKNNNNKNEKNVKSEIFTNIDVNPCNKSIVNKKYNDDDSIDDNKLDNCNKNEVVVGAKCVSEVNLKSRIKQNSDPRYLVHTRHHDNDNIDVPNTTSNTNSNSTSTSLSSPFKNQRISPIVLDNTSLMNILTERSLPKTNIKSDISAYVKFCGNIYDSDTDDEGRYRSKDDRNSILDHQISTYVCDSSSNMEGFIFSQTEIEIHKKTNNYNNNNNNNKNNNNNDNNCTNNDVKMKTNECVDSVKSCDNDNSKNDNNDNDNDNESVINEEGEEEGERKLLTDITRTKTKTISNIKEKEIEKVEEKGGFEVEVEVGGVTKMEGMDMQCDQKYSEDLLLFSASNSITLPHPTKYNNGSSNKYNNENNGNNENLENNDILDNNMFLSSILGINSSKEKNKEKERDFMNDSNRQLSSSLLPIIIDKDDINDRIQALRNEIDFNNILNAQSMRFLDAKSLNNKEKMNSNNLNNELLHATVTDLIEYNTDNDSFPCDNISEESSQLFTFPTIQNSNTFDNTSDSDCVPLPLHYSQPSMALLKKDDEGNKNKINEIQRLQLFTPTDNKFNEKNYVDKNESKIFDDDNDDNEDDDDENDNRGDNGSDNNVERDSGICPFAISLNEHNFPFIDIALSTYNVFDARTNSTSNINSAEYNKKEDSNDDLQKMTVKVIGKKEYNDNIILNVLQHVQIVNNNDNKSEKEKIKENEKEKGTNSIQIDYKNFYRNENETLKKNCSQNILQNSLRNKDENVLEEGSGKDVEGMIRLTSILTAFKTALKLKNVLFSLLIDKEESQNSLNISGNIKSIKQNSLKLDTKASTAALTNIATYNSNSTSESINEKIVSYKKEENENEINNFKNQILGDNNILSDANTKKIVKELIQFLSSKHIGSNLKFGDSQLTASSLSSFDFVEFFLFFLDIQVFIHLFDILLLCVCFFLGIFFQNIFSDLIT